jgi:hypothetical protein
MSLRKETELTEFCTSQESLSSISENLSAKSQEFLVTKFGNSVSKPQKRKKPKTNKSSPQIKENSVLAVARMRKELSTDEVFLTEMNQAIALLKSDQKLRAKVLNDNIAQLSDQFD